MHNSSEYEMFSHNLGSDLCFGRCLRLDICLCLLVHKRYVHLRNEFNFWNVHGIMNTSDLLQSK